MDPKKQILVAIDFSPSSMAALARARRIAEWMNASLSVLHVVEPPFLADDGPLGPMGVALPIVTHEELVASARERWKTFVQQCPSAKDVQLTIDVGHPRDCIITAVANEKPQLLVVGAHGAMDAHRGIGMTASACAQWAATQVMIVRPGEAGPFRSVAACVDFSDTSRIALEQAISIAAEDGAELHILHVYSDPWRGTIQPLAIQKNMPDFARKYREGLEDRLREFCRPLAHELGAVKAEFHAVQAEAHALGIMSFAWGHACDLVVLGTRGKFNMRDFFWGSTAERIVREAPCSVLAVKPRSYVKPEAYQPFADTAAAMQSA